MEEEHDEEVILLAKSQEYVELYKMIAGNSNSDNTFSNERCPKCNDCKVCRQTKDTKNKFKEAEQDYIRKCVVFDKEEKRFYAHLPWKLDPSLLQGNYSIALKSHDQAKRKAYKSPGYPALAKEAFGQMIDRGTVASVSKLPLGNGTSDGLQDHLNSIKAPQFTVNQLVFKLSSTSTQCRITMDGS